MVLVLRPEEIDGLITIKEAIKVVEEGFRHWTQHPDFSEVRHRTHMPSNVRVSVHQGGMPSVGVTGLMTHCEWTTNPTKAGYSIEAFPVRGRPVQVLYDADNGELRCIIIGEPKPKELSLSGVSALRTAANSAVGTDVFARKDAQTVGMLGSQNQAKYHLIALNEMRKLKSVKVYSPNPEHRKQFADQMGSLLNLEVRVVESASEAVREVDIVVAATSSNVPVLDGQWLEPGVHVTSIVVSNIGLKRGGFVPQMRQELDDESMRRAEVIGVNSRETIRVDQPGDFVDRLEKGIISWQKIVEVGEVLNGLKAGRTKPEQITLFKNTGGVGISDVAIGGRLYQLAKERGLGLELPIDGAEWREPL
ncbi:MAG TPA: ornithine cyclodeaminase family protein [Candidatus Binatia bacterium]|nr:ornithine cyclodeaminase family protein [Candidatus Binatia bacterium]